MEELSGGQARRIALAAQGFTDPPPGGVVDRRHLRRVLRRTGLLQIDSVNVLARAHYLPAFSRLGPYPVAQLDRMAYADRELFEYWGHEASLLPVDLHPLLRWRMARAATGEAWGGLVRLARERPDLVARVEAEVAGRGPLRAGELSEPGARRGSWWGWDDTKQAFEWLFWTGRFAVARRGANFERLYDLSERVLPPAILAAPTVEQDAAQRALLLRAARSLGVGTARDLADYHRINIREARARVAELAEDGALLPVRVEGWRDPAFLHPEARLPRWVRARALLVPFDPLIWERSRVERLFGFHLRIEIYTPARSGATATTCSRCCWATRWSRASTSRPTARPGSCAWSPRTPSRGPTGAPPRTPWRPSWRASRAGSASAGSTWPLRGTSPPRCGRCSRFSRPDGRGTRQRSPRPPRGAGWWRTGRTRAGTWRRRPRTAAPAGSRRPRPRG